MVIEMEENDIYSVVVHKYSKNIPEVYTFHNIHDADTFVQNREKEADVHYCNLNISNKYTYWEM